MGDAAVIRTSSDAISCGVVVLLVLIALAVTTWLTRRRP